MKTVLLAGGLGVRLRPLTYTIPKPLLPVGEHPILEEIIIRLKRFELRDIVMAVGYRAELIETYFRDGSHLGVHVEYAHESEPLGTAGPLAVVRKQFGHSVKENDSLLVMNGDLLTELDMRLVIDFHETAGNDITVVTREFQLKHPYGVIEIDGDHITNVIEKPSVIDTINAGIYVFRWSALELVPDGQTFEMPELLNTALESGRSVRAYPFSGAWLAIDGMEQLEDAARIVSAVREMKLSIIIPVRNEVQTIATLVERVQAVDYGRSKEIIVVDGASTDGTREVLLGLPASPELLLVLEDEARGKGRAVRTGFERATGDVLVVQDADLELDPGQIPALLEHLVSGGRPAVFGSRFKDQGRGGTPLLSYVGNKFLTWSANVLFFTRMTDILTCYKVLRSDVVETLNLECDGFDFDVEVPCRLLRQGHRILEVPVTYNPRSIEEGKKLTTRVGWSVLRAILHVRFSRSSVRSDLPSSVGSQ